MVNRSLMEVWQQHPGDLSMDRVFLKGLGPEHPTLYMTSSPSVQARAFPEPLGRSSALPLCPRDTGRA